MAEAASHLSSVEDAPDEEIRSELQNPGESISWKSVKFLASKTDTSISDLLEASGLYFPKKKKEPNPELEKILEDCKRQVEENEYLRMISPVFNKREKPHYNVSNEWKEVNKLVITIFNVLFSVVASGFMTYYLLGSFSLETRVFAGISIGIVVGVAEAVLVYLSVNDEPKKPSKRMRGAALHQKLE